MTASLFAGERATRTDAGPPAEGGAPLRVVVQLRDELRAKAVRFCHWKSNDMLARSLSGEKDLHLLVHRDDARRFLSVLARLGFNRAVEQGGREHPGVAHFYGLDRASGRLVHVNAHFQLVLGDDTTMNYRLPIEAAYLASTRHDEALPAPAPEFELALFVVRMMLRHATWDAIAVGLGRLSADEQRELAWLLARADAEATRAVVTHHLGGVEVALWDRCLASLTDGSLRRRVSLGGELLTALAPHGRRSRAGRRRDPSPAPGQLGMGAVGAAATDPQPFRACWAHRRGRRWRRVREEHGGAGRGRLARDDLRREARPPRQPAALLAHPRRHVPAVRRSAAGRLVRTRRSADPPRAKPDDVPDAASALWQALTARDRLREYHALRRVADAGGVVVCDGWPLPQLHHMDAARVSWVLDGDGPRSQVVRWLAEAERRSRAPIALPDVLIVLRLDPEVAVSRCPEEDPDDVRRNSQVFDTDWSTTAAVVIDATQPPELVLAGIRAAIWDRL